MHGFLTRSKAFLAKDAVQGLQQAFHDCEAEFIQIAGREGLRDGTTAIVALIHDDALTVGPKLRGAPDCRPTAAVLGAMPAIDAGVPLADHVGPPVIPPTVCGSAADNVDNGPP